MMKRFTILGILLTLGCATALASVDVTNLYLEKTSQFTEFTIQCDQDFSYTHQMVEASGDKPFRIVVDIQDALHQLPQNDFANLPKSSIERIRTSQYSVEPEKIVRVVLDMQGALTYKLKKHDGKLTLLINTPDDKNFPTWSAASRQKTTYAAETATAKPKTMPARPGNEASAPTVDKKKPEKTELQLTTKPSHSHANQPVTEETPSAEPSEADIQAFVEVFAGKPEGEQSSTGGAIEDSASPAKRADSVGLNQEKTGPAEDVKHLGPQAKPPKTEKTALPETRATGKPVLADPESGQGGVKGGNDQATSKSKTDSVHKKYLARSRGDVPQKSPYDDIVASRKRRPLDKVERIRQKYSHGISFIRDDRDARRLALQKQEKEEQEQQPNLLQDDFIPQRQVVVYNSGGLRDPFAPLVDEADRVGEKIEPPDVRSLHLIGLLRDGPSSRGLFEDFNGFGYILQVGDPVKDGYLVSVDENEAVFQIREYGWTRTIALELEDEY
jgi:hypothetical protein